MQNSIFIAQESSRHLGVFIKNSPSVNRIDFLNFCVYKTFRRKKLSVYKFKLQLLPSLKDNVQVFIHTKSNKNVSSFYIKKVGHLKKTRQFMLRYIYI